MSFHFQEKSYNYISMIRTEITWTVRMACGLCQISDTFVSILEFQIICVTRQNNNNKKTIFCFVPIINNDLLVRFS